MQAVAYGKDRYGNIRKGECGRCHMVSIDMVIFARGNTGGGIPSPRNNDAVVDIEEGFRSSRPSSKSLHMTLSEIYYGRHFLLGGINN